MSGSTGGWDSTLGTVGATGGFNNVANNGQVFANSDYAVNTESLVGKPSSYFQNNNTKIKLNDDRTMYVKSSFRFVLLSVKMAVIF